MPSRHEISKLGTRPDEAAADLAEARIRGRRPDGWRKKPDQALGDAVAHRLARRRSFER